MCGRTAMYIEPEEVQQKTKITKWIHKERYRKSFNVTPMKQQPIITKDHVLQTMKWGLIPSWSKDGKALTINCRDDSVETKPLYRPLKDKQRCIVLCQGFYEWRSVGKSKFPFYFTLANPDELMYVAAFCNTWRNKSDETEQIDSYALITTDSKNHSVMASIHDRMPLLLLDEKSRNEWLNTEKTYDQVKHLIEDYDQRVKYQYEDAADTKEKDLSNAVIVRPVGKAVSSIKNDSEDCVKRSEHNYDEQPATTPSKKRKPEKGEQKITKFFPKKPKPE